MLKNIGLVLLGFFVLFLSGFLFITQTFNSHYYFENSIGKKVNLDLETKLRIILIGNHLNLFESGVVVRSGNGFFGEVYKIDKVNIYFTDQVQAFGKVTGEDNEVNFSFSQKFVNDNLRLNIQVPEKILLGNETGILSAKLTGNYLLKVLFLSGVDYLNVDEINIDKDFYFKNNVDKLEVQFTDTRKISIFKVKRAYAASCSGYTLCGTGIRNCSCSAGSGFLCTVDGGYCGDYVMVHGTCSCSLDLDCVNSWTTGCGSPPSCSSSSCGTYYGMSLYCGLNTCACVPSWPDCETDCGYPGGYRYDGCGNSGWCNATAACCSPTNPNAPSLSSPANGAAVVSPVGLSWQAPSSWGEECSCSATRTYRLCVSATDSSNPCSTGITASGLTGLSYSVSRSPGVYYWTVRAVNKCGNVSANAPVRSFRVNSPPTLNNSPPGTYLVLQNSVATVVPVDVGSSNHICQTTFTTAPATPRQIRLVVTATDADGGSNISTVAVRLNAATTVNSAGVVTGDWALVSGVTNSVSGNNRTYTFHMNLGNSLDSNTLYNLSATATDAWGATTGWVDSGRDFKSWDCKVTVSGGMYDGSAGAVCTTTIGYTTTVGDSFNFQSLRFNKTSDNSKVNMTVTRPATYNSGSNYLLWGNSYNNQDTDFNYNQPGDGDLEGTIPQRRVSGGSMGAGVYSCGAVDLTNSTMIDPYSAVTSLVADFSSTVNQQPWWQVEGGGIRMTNTVSNMVPVTCAVDTTGTCRAAMNVSDILLNNSNGLVSGTIFDNNSGCGSLCLIGLPDDRYYTANLLNKTYSYNVLRQDYFLKYNEGVEVANDWDVISGNTTDKVFFVNGNLVIDSNLTLLPNEFKMVIVSGNITIDPTVSRLDGIYLADNGFNIGGTNNSQLVIQGILHSSGGNVIIDRSYVDGSLNNTSPAVLIKYRPDIIFSMPTNLTRALSGWKGGI